MSLVARHLETVGLPTVVIGSGRDIVEQCGVARFLFTDFPLGNPCGKPGDTEMQRAIVGMALDLLALAFAPRTTVQTPFSWSDDNSWRDNYMRIDPNKKAEFQAAGKARRLERAEKRVRLER